MFKKTFKYIFIMIFATGLVTISIDAADNYDNLSQSFLGKVFFGDSGPCPSDMVFVPTDIGGFCIDKFEVSPGKKCPSLVTNNQNDSRLNMINSDCVPVSVKNASPWVYVSQYQAREACARAGKRLPTNKEWLLASLGTPDKNSSWESSDCQVAENWDKQPGLTGSGEKCVSSFGVFDMIGNVWEWTDETINNGKLNGEDLPTQGFVYEANDGGIAMVTGDEENKNFNQDYFWIKKTGFRGIAKGGFYSNKSTAGIYSSYLVSEPSYVGVGVGFRCVK